MQLIYYTGDLLSVSPMYTAPFLASVLASTASILNYTPRPTLDAHTVYTVHTILCVGGLYLYDCRWNRGMSVISHTEK